MLVFILALAFLPLHVQSLYVFPTSSCFQTCVSGTPTGTGDLVCSDNQYFSSSLGIAFRECSKCELSSLAGNSTVNDQYWAIFHMKFTQNQCIFESKPPTNSIQACSAECEPLRTALSVNPIGTQPWKEQYEYCSDDSNSYTKNGPGCAKCLQAQAGSVVLGNFMDQMVSLCADRPYASKSASIKTARDLYDTSTIMASPSTTATSATSTLSLTSSASITGGPSTAFSSQAQAGASSVNAESSDPAALPNQEGHHLSTGAAAGIGVVCALVGVAIVAAIVWMLLRNLKKRKTLHELPAKQYGSEREELSGTNPYGMSQKEASELGESKSRPELGESQSRLDLGDGKARPELDTSDAHQDYKPRLKGNPVEMPS